MKKVCKWAFCLQKRLYKKATFLAILAVIVLSVVLLQLAAMQGSGFVRVALVQENPDDAVSSAIVSECLADNRLIAFRTCASKAEGLQLLKTGKADAVWVFPSDMQTEVDAFAKDTAGRQPFVSVIEREQTVLMRLAEEKLAAKLYEHAAPSVYIAYVRGNIAQLNDMSDAELLSHYEAFQVNGELFTFSSPDGNVSTENVSNIGYLLAPIRGLLSVLVVLCGLAAAIFYMQDEQSGTYALLPIGRKPFVAFGGIGIAVFNVALVMVLSLVAVGVHTTLLRECLLLVLYSICCTLFCMVMQQLFGSIRVLGAFMPLLVLLMIGICPVFFDVREIAVLQLVFPPTYYVNAAYNNAYVFKMLLYCVGLLVVWFAVGKLRKKL